jgi:omega-6 fatty acid desaturase (delta-12 desaturase)
MAASAESDDCEQFDQSVLAPHTVRQILLPVAIFLVSTAIYLCCAAGAVIAADTAAKILLGVIAGVFIANLAIIGHDAVHRSFTSSRWLNRLIGTLAFLPALHPYGRWEHHHNRVHHRYTAQIGIDNAYSPMTVDQYRAASGVRRVYYRFMRSLAGQPFFYMIDIWLPKIFLPLPREANTFRTSDWVDLAIVYVWLGFFVAALTLLAQFYSHQTFGAALWNAAMFGFVIPFLVWNVFISFVTIVQHTGPRAHWILPTGRPSTHQQKLHGTVHVRFPEPIDWFFHRVMQHIAHHVNPIVPLYRLKGAETLVTEQERERSVIETWTPAYHWRLARDCKLYDPIRDGWCKLDAAQHPQSTGAGLALQ